MADSRDRTGRYEEAEKALQEFYARLDAGEALDFGAWSAGHAALAHELRELHENCAMFRAPLEQSIEGAGLAASRPVDPTTAVDRLVCRLTTGSNRYGDYAIGELIARGGMGEIRAVRDEVLGRELAMKTLRRESGGRHADATRDTTRRLSRFIEEAQITSQLAHPGIVPVHELGLAPDGRPYFTMKCVHGRTLRTVLEHYGRSDPDWPLSRVVSIFLRICETMAYAHSRGVVHRDLKPANVMVGDFGEVYVMDWGLARVNSGPSDDDSGSSDAIATTRGEDKSSDPDSYLHTQAGRALGTPQYMAPEQAGGRILGPAVDVYAVGAMLYHFLAGQAPYSDTDLLLSSRSLVDRVRAGPPRPLHELAPTVPREIRAICAMAMARDPAQRYHGMSEIAADLRAFQEDRIGVAWQDTLLVRAAKAVRRNPSRSIAVASAAVLVPLALFAVAQSNLRTMSERQTEHLALARLGDDVLADYRRLREVRGDSEIATGVRDYKSLVDRYMGALGSYGIHLLPDVDARSIAARIDALAGQREEVRDALVWDLYEVARHLNNLGARAAWRQKQGYSIGRRNDSPAALAAEASARRLLEEKSPLIELWPRLQSLILDVDQDSWRKTAWQTMVDWWDHQGELPGIEPADDTDAATLTWYARFLLDTPQEARAITILERAVRQDPSCFQAHFDLATLYSRGSNPGEIATIKAIEQATAAVACDDTSAWAHLNLGKFLVDHAIVLGQKIERGTNTLEPVDLLELDQERQARVANARLHYERAIHLDPKYATAYQNLANLIVNAEPDLAEEYARQAIELASEDTLARRAYASFALDHAYEQDEAAARAYDAGEGTEAQAKLVRATQWYDEALRTTPDHDTLLRARSARAVAGLQLLVNTDAQGVDESKVEAGLVELRSTIDAHSAAAVDPKLKVPRSTFAELVKHIENQRTTSLLETIESEHERLAGSVGEVYAGLEILRSRMSGGGD